MLQTKAAFGARLRTVPSAARLAAPPALGNAEGLHSKKTAAALSKILLVITWTRKHAASSGKAAQRVISLNSGQKGNIQMRNVEDEV
jgi:hypothetical protein